MSKLFRVWGLIGIIASFSFAVLFFISREWRSAILCFIVGAWWAWDYKTSRELWLDYSEARARLEQIEADFRKEMQ